MINIKTFDQSRQIAIIWDIEDVQDIRPDLSDTQAMEVLLEVEHRHDSSIGISWDTLDIWAQELFPVNNDGNN